MMELKDYVLMDSASGQYHYKGIVVKAYQNCINKADWIFLVGYPGTQGKFWNPPIGELSMNDAVAQSVEWYLQEAEQQPLVE